MSVVLFDLDGTLTDPRVGITRSVAYALARFGVEVEDTDSLVPFIGPPLDESFVKLGGLAEADAWSAVLAYREYYTETGMFENAVYDGIADALATLGARGWRLGVATSKPTVFAERILEHFELRAAFDVVAGAELDGSRQHKHDVIYLRARPARRRSVTRTRDGRRPGARHRGRPPGRALSGRRHVGVRSAGRVDRRRP